MDRFRTVDPGQLRLPSSRQDGADWLKYVDQVRRFGGNVSGMPIVEVTEGKDGLLAINNGVTRATRIHYLSPGLLIKIEVTDVQPLADFSKSKRVCDVPPPVQIGR